MRRVLRQPTMWFSGNIFNLKKEKYRNNLPDVFNAIIGQYLFANDAAFCTTDVNQLQIIADVSHPSKQRRVWTYFITQEE